MISWWLGRPAECATNDDGELDPPETPAPVFAARAIKSAIFGTPAPEGNYEDGEETAAQKPVTSSDIRLAAPQIMAVGSPTKPQGILLTPGTATTRRKTVTFGAAVVDNEGKGIGKSGIPNNCPGKFPSPWTPKVDRETQSRPAKKTSLTRTLEAAAREGKPKKATGSRNKNEPVQLELSSGVDPNPERDSGDADLKERAPKRMRSNSVELFDGDMTLDLNEPHSQSGRYWKSEYERYHEEAKTQMKKLVKYKQLAKSYAKKKDGEAIDLGEKLKEEKQKVAVMEDRVADLISRIADRNTDGEHESPQLIRELAKQTALAIQYRDQVQEFQSALQERDEEMNERGAESDAKLVSPRTANTLVDTTKELRKARKQLGEMSSLQAEMHRLRLDLQAAEKKAAKLRDENARLSGDLGRVKSELLDSEQRRHSAEQSQPREEALLRLQKDYDTLKELAKSQRRDAEHLLQKRHDQVADLRKQIAALKGLPPAKSEEQAKSAVPYNNSGSTRLQKPEPEAMKDRSGDLIDLISLDTPDENFPRKRVPTHTRMNSTQKVCPISRDEDSLLESKIPILDRSTKKSLAVAASQNENGNEHTQTKMVIRRKSQSALGEITNNSAVVDRPIAVEGKPANSPFTTSFHERFSNLSLESPTTRLPSLEPSWNPSVQSLKAKPQALSPRLSMFNIPSSQPSYTLPRPRSSGNESNEKGPPLPPSSRLSSMSSTRARVALPPERAAAAKARLEQKKRENSMAERKRIQEVDEGKENIRN